MLKYGEDDVHDLEFGLALTASEATPLLQSPRPAALFTELTDPDSTSPKRTSEFSKSTNPNSRKRRFSLGDWTRRHITWTNTAKVARTSITCLPAVFLSLTLNVLDAMSYGIIVFPQSDPYMPQTATQSGIQMFLVSTIISQLVYTLGGSKFLGANGSMMIEVMPFLHIMCRIIEEQIGPDNSEAILPTIMVSYAMSTLLTGLTFLLLGIFKLGNIIQFFPRHILVGCIGGIGLFLMETAIEVSTGVKLELSTAKQLFLEPANVMLWGSGLAIALTLKLMQRFISHPLFVPSFYVAVPLLFYVLVWALGISMAELRKGRWLFDLPDAQSVPYYTFWTYYDFSKTIWSALPATIPTQLALVFFGILHVPINVPALAVSTHQDVDTNLEIVGHGISNLLAGFVGTVQNYLVYANSVLSIRSGGASRVFGILLAAATTAIWIAGGSVIGLVPTAVVTALIFHLGIDLMKESVWDTLHVGMHPLEYFTILAIVGIMGIWGFTEGIIVGIILACFFFVVMNARKSVIRSSYTGAALRSTVHRLYRQQRFLDQVGSQITIIKVCYSFVFFGTIHQLDVYIQDLLEKSEKTRFVVLDFSLISGIDYSAVEAFLRVKRVLTERRIHLVFSGLGDVARELAKAGVFDPPTGNQHGPANGTEVEDQAHESLTSSHLPNGVGHISYTNNFATLDQALEWCENILLATYYRKLARLAAEEQAKGGAGHETTYANLMSQLRFLMHSSGAQRPTLPVDHPVFALLQAVSEVGDLDSSLGRICSRFERISLRHRVDSSEPHVLWHPGDAATELYLIEKGELVLVSESQVENGASDTRVVETLLPGSMVGELEVFSGRPRTCRLQTREAIEVVVWKLDADEFEEVVRTEPALAVAFIRVALGFDSERMWNVVMHGARLWSG
ncbi:sulfate transporter family-domain-containing protein [Cladochytrium replicatum]|nr:sulfate transporter family-domain-containing protein [Cladochytrium replicatum]